MTDRLPDTGRAFALDTHMVDDASAAMTALRDRAECGAIRLSRTDTMDTELVAAPEDKRADLLDQSAEFVEHLGPAFWGHSRWDHAVWACEADVAHLNRVFAVIHPSVDKGIARKQHVRDAMHIATAIRYGDDGFITNDRGILNKAKQIADAFDGFLLLTPSEALARVDRLIERARVRSADKQAPPQS